MIKGLIVDDNFSYSKNILNKIMNEITEINIKYITTTVRETIDILQKENIDLIFLDLELQDGTGIDIINEIKCMNLINKPDIIIISGNITLVNQVIKNNENYQILSKTQTNEQIQRFIKDYIHNKKFKNEEKQIRDKIISEIKNIGYNFKYIGTVYILESILYVYMSNNLDLLDNLESNVYKYVSFKYNKSLNNIKTNIIKATMKINRNKQITVKDLKHFMLLMLWRLQL